MPVRSSPQAATDKWLTNLGNARQAMTAGANRVSVSPGQLAAAAADKWIARLQQSKQKFIDRVGGVTVDQWRTAYLTYGIDRVATGAAAKQHKMLSFQTDWQNYLAANMSKIDRMPTTSLADGVAKAVAQIQLNAQFKRGAGR